MIFPESFTIKDKLFFLIYPFLRIKILIKIVKPFLKHPILTFKNLKYFHKVRKEENEITFLGVKNENDFLNYIESLKEKYKSGKIKKPEIVIFKAYCEKPVKCVCNKSESSKYFKENAEKRFNEFCGLKERETVCKDDIYGKCKIGETYKEIVESESLKPEIIIMLDENQMTDIWEDFLDFQSKNGYIKPFIMDVCPLAHWIAEMSLFRLKTPIGIIFPLEENVCKNMKEYISADGGMKKEKHPTTQSISVQKRKRILLKKLGILKLSN